jgi:aspartyl-tRNA synthetase
MPLPPVACDICIADLRPCTTQLEENEKASFNHLLHALSCGAPPHGGIALGECRSMVIKFTTRFNWSWLVLSIGFDRLVATLCNASSIRDVIAFPKTSAGTDALLRSPTPIHRDILHQYGIQPRSILRRDCSRLPTTNRTQRVIKAS